MAKRRVKALTFTGEGKGLYITGVPARDLSEDEITSLTEQQYLDATEGKDPLYTAVEAKQNDAPKSDAKGKE